ALSLPLVIGPWSDTFQTPMGRRRPFMLAPVGPMGFCLALIAFMPNIWTVTLIVLAFFSAYYVYEPPYRGLYPVVLHESMYGRSDADVCRPLLHDGAEAAAVDVARRAGGGRGRVRDRGGRRGAARRQVRTRPRDLRCLVRLRGRPAGRRPRPGMAQLVLRAD